MATYARIVADERHDDVRLLVEESIHTRRFPEWSMAYDRETDGVEVPEGFSTFLDRGDDSADQSRPASCCGGSATTRWRTRRRRRASTGATPDALPPSRSETRIDRVILVR